MKNEDARRSGWLEKARKKARHKHTRVASVLCFSGAATLEASKPKLINARVVYFFKSVFV